MPFVSNYVLNNRGIFIYNSCAVSQIWQFL